jgi:glutamine synthetase
VLKLGVDIIPGFTRDNTDRNRTSPFAFTGNKFEFRSLGSSNSIACANMMLNSAVAESLKIYADRLEKEENFEDALHEMIKKTIHDHKRILFNGNGYDESWVKEATEVRGLLNYVSTPDCMPHLLDEKNVTMLTSLGVFSVDELKSRRDIMLENYCKSVLIEANTMINMVHKRIAPAICRFTADLAKQATEKKALFPDVACSYETDLVTRLSALTDNITERTDALEDAVMGLSDAEDIIAESVLIRDTVLPKMSELRIPCDQAELLTAKNYWPFPTYGDILFSVK